MSALRIDSLRDLEGSRIKLEDGNASKLVAIRIEELVIVNVGMLADDPFPVRLEISLRRLAFDPIAQCVLALVGMGKVELVEKEKTTRKKCGSQQYRYHDAINTGSRRLDGGDLIRALHYAEGDEDGQQHG